MATELTTKEKANVLIIKDHFRKDHLWDFISKWNPRFFDNCGEVDELYGIQLLMPVSPPMGRRNLIEREKFYTKILFEEALDNYLEDKYKYV